MIRRREPIEAMLLLPIERGAYTMLDFRMNTFLAVCRSMNFTRAAEELHITQPAVSQHIRYLENSYGVKLFTYQGKRLSLTVAGEALFSAATTMQHDGLFLKEQLRSLDRGRKSLVFGATLTVGEFVAPDRLAACLLRYPETDVHLLVANTHELLQRIDAGEIDFAIVEGFFEKREYDSLRFSREKYVAVCGVQHPFAAQPRRVEDLLSERLLLREKGSGTREILERYLEGRNLTVQDFRQTAQVSNLHAIKTLAQHGCGVTFLYEAAVREELESGKLRTLPIEDFPLHHDFTFLWRHGSLFAGRYREIFDFMQNAGINAVPAETGAGSTGQPQNGPDSLTTAPGGDMV